LVALLPLRQRFLHLTRSLATCCHPHQGFLCGRLAEREAPPAFSPLALDAMRRAWTESLDRPRPTHHRGGPPAEPGQTQHGAAMVAEALTKAGLKFDRQRLTKDGLAVIDFALQAGPERFIALQVRA
jgi:hypothetical protein